MRLLCWNVNSIRTLPSYMPWCMQDNPSLETVLDSFEANILCLQELKVPKTPVVLGYEAYASASRVKQGYSGVATYCKPETCIQAEEGIAGTLVPSGRPHVSTAGLQELSERFSKSQLRSFDQEGRCVITDHGAFVLFNVYFPNAGDTLHRQEFKMTFYEAFEIRCKAIIDSGRSVIVCGDVNCALEEIDQCEPERVVKECGFNSYEEMPSQTWMRGFLNNTGLTDLFRKFHPHQRGAFTCWNTRLNARESNNGARIDYVLTAPESLTGLSSGCFHLNKTIGSDHCPVVAEFEDSILPKVVRGRLPYLCTRNNSKQLKVSSFFKKKSDEDYSKPLPTASRKRKGSPATLEAFGFSKTSTKTAVALEYQGKSVGAKDKATAKNEWKGLLSGVDAPTCNHHEEAVKRKVSKKGTNLGRSFYACKYPEKAFDPTGKVSCKFFKWV